MSTETALTMQDLELETAELLPSRETLCCGCHPHPCCRPFLELSVCLNIGL
jgi:hypothetical protein